MIHNSPGKRRWGGARYIWTDEMIQVMTGNSCRSENEKTGKMSEKTLKYGL